MYSYVVFYKKREDSHSLILLNQYRRPGLRTPLSSLSNDKNFRSYSSLEVNNPKNCNTCKVDSICCKYEGNLQNKDTAQQDKGKKPVGGSSIYNSKHLTIGSDIIFPYMLRKNLNLRIWYMSLQM